MTLQRNQHLQNERKLLLSNVIICQTRKPTFKQYWWRTNLIFVIFNRFPGGFNTIRFNCADCLSSHWMTHIWLHAHNDVYLVHIWLVARIRQKALLSFYWHNLADSFLISTIPCLLIYVSVYLTYGWLSVIKGYKYHSVPISGYW